MNPSQKGKPTLKAHELLSDINKWTKGTMYRNAIGESCPMESAVQFCAAGAVCSVGGDYDKANGAALRMHGLNLTSVNDGLGYDAVLAVLREADV